MKRKSNPFSQSHRENISKAMKGNRNGEGNKGKKHTDEQNQRQREFNLANPPMYWLGKKRPFNLLKQRFPDRLYWNKDWLYEQYVINERSSGDIAKEINVHPNRILHHLGRINVKRRPLKGRIITKNPVYRTIHAWLVKSYGLSKMCENTKCPRISKRYDYALKRGCSHERNKDNYKSLCHHCHRVYDANSYAVYFNKTSKKWVAQISLKKSIFLGSFKTKEEAIERSREERRKYYDFVD